MAAGRLYIILDSRSVAQIDSQRLTLWILFRSDAEELVPGVGAEACDSFLVYQARGSPMSSAMAMVRRRVNQSGLMFPMPSCLV